MRLVGKKILLKLKRKNIGNRDLCGEIEKLIHDIECFNPISGVIAKIRDDADRVHNDGFYFFDIAVHRALILIEIEDYGEATVVWAGTHKEYETVFKNNKSTIERWLRNKGYIL